MLGNSFKSFGRQYKQLKRALGTQHLQQFCYCDNNNPTNSEERGDSEQPNATSEDTTTGTEQVKREGKKSTAQSTNISQSPEARKLMQHLANQTGNSSKSVSDENQQEMSERIKKGAKKISILFGPSADYLQPYVKSDKQSDQSFQDIKEDMAHPETGYRDLGQESQEGEDKDFSMSRIHPEKIFQPGDTYTPEDLNPFESVRDQRKREEEEQKFLRKPRKPLFTDKDVKQKSSFTNVPFLVNFMTETGKIVPQRISRLSKKYHRQVSKNIKVSRQMALMPPEGRPTIGLLDKATIQRIQARQEAEQKLVADK
eukprot:TRINITY_DN1699_c0_g1_i2.p1 TRINITY_DN1699_c0_g1~~TRINITY_DN1699_c0_g1_i2.p1  ORF type:complete len:326 (-),score=51.51 TRINITY_DN1699_c0_g1_i2:839-1777(-)